MNFPGAAQSVRARGHARAQSNCVALGPISLAGLSSLPGRLWNPRRPGASMRHFVVASRAAALFFPQLANDLRRRVCGPAHNNTG
jgi:hypothetical protein